MSKKVFRRPAVSSVAVAKGLKTASMDAIADAVADLDPPERLVVEGATVVCTQMFEPESESKMKKTEGSIGIMRQGAYELTYKDIEFEPLFEKCKKCGGDCEPEIEDEQWFDYDDTNEINDEYGILEEKSFMVCLKGYGILYISEDGQRPSDMKRLLAMLAIKLGNRELLGKMMCAAFGGDPVNMATGNFIFARTDLEIGGHIPIKFQRFYNTFDKQVNSLGKGWRHPFDISLKETNDGVVITFEDGHDEVYALGGAEAEKKEDKPKKEEPASNAPKGYFFEMMAKEKEQQRQKQKNKKNDKPQEKPKGYRLSKPGETLPNVDDKNYDASDGNFSNLMKVRDNYRLVRPDGTTLHFDQDGKLIKIDDQNQVETVLSYDGNKLIKVVGLSGYLAFTYFDGDKIDNNKIATVTDHTGRTVSYTYDGDLLTSATDPLGGVRTYSYDEKERFLNEINPEGNLIVENEYDGKDRVIKQSYADGSEMSYDYEDREMQNIGETLKTEFTAQNGAKTIYHRDIQYRTVEVEYPDHGIMQTEYNWKHQKISETDNIGPRNYYDYDEKGNLTHVKNPLGEITELVYDEKDRLESIVSNGVVRLRSEYDELDNLVLAEDALKRQVRFSYDKKTRGLPTHIVQPDGSVIKVKFDDRRNVIEVIDAHGVSNHFEYDSLNRMIKTIDGNENETQFSYDLNNNLTRIINAEGNSQTYVYNKANKLTSATDFNGATISFDYSNVNKPSTITDQLGRVTKFGYDEMWNVSSVELPNGAKTNFKYDESNRLVTVEKPDGNIIQYTYDENGNRTSIIDEEGNTISLEYDELQRLIEISDDEGVQLAYTYNDDGQITRITDAMDNTKQFVYNDGGELVKETNALGDSKTYTYTSLGKIKTETDEAGRVTKHEYESGGRLKRTVYWDDTTETFEYDGNGNVKIYKNEENVTTHYNFDAFNRVTQISVVGGGLKQCTYDTVGNVTSVTDELGNMTKYEYTLSGELKKVIEPLGSETHYTYDSLDQLISVKRLGEIHRVSDIELATVEVDRVTKYHRNILGQITSVTDALGYKEHYKYSPTGRPIEKLDKDGFTTVYNYTKQGDLSYIKYQDEKEVHLSYNALRQLTKVKDCFGTTNIEVDPLGRAVSIINQRNQQLKYSYGSATRFPISA